MEAGKRSRSLEKHGPQRAHVVAELWRISAEVWYRGAWLLAGLAKRHGAEYYHFLQPNQHVPGSKPLTDRELAKAFKLDGRAENIRAVYPLLAEYGRHLREQGVEFFDLSQIYADNRQTLYRDRCCHLNRRGNKLLAAAMLQRIIKATDANDGAIYPESKSRSCLRPYRAVVARIEAGEYGEPAARSVFDIYRGGREGRTLVYMKRNCTVDDITAPFFLYITRTEGDIWGGVRDSEPSNVFHFVQHGAILDGGTCVAIVRLVDGGLIRIHTGQRGIWSAEPDVAGLDVPT